VVADSAFAFACNGYNQLTVAQNCSIIYISPGRIGDRLDVLGLGRTITVEIANLRRIEWLDLSLNFVMVLSPGALAGAPATHIATISGTPAAAEDLMVEVTDRFPNVSAVSVGDAVRQAGALIEGVAGAVRITAIAVLAAGALVAAAALGLALPAGAPGDDVDGAADGTCTIQKTRWPANHFHPVVDPAVHRACRDRVLHMDAVEQLRK